MRSAKIRLSAGKDLDKARAWANPVVPGDHPDPTILEVDGVFWASATSGEWSPQFPLFRSDDLVRWEPRGAIFAVQPDWAEGSFWAPELVHDEVSGRFVAWYVGRRRGGPLCVAVATAERAEGPYQDHGPLICEEDGSIDPCFARDEHGAPYLIWKEDGNSAQRPTPIWAQPLSDDLLRLAGEKTMLIVNDQPWEEDVVEGPYILRHSGWFYMFYAGNSCCGRKCKYAEGVARSQRLLGPWEKFAGNPIIGANDNWRCPGHGTAVHKAGEGARRGQDYLLYHAYPAAQTIYVGREAVLDEIQWQRTPADAGPGWPVINQGRGPGAPSPASEIDFVDQFRAEKLGPAWQWPVNTQPEVRVGVQAVDQGGAQPGVQGGVQPGAGLRLAVQRESPFSPRPVESAMIAVPQPVGKQYRATVTVEVQQRCAELWAGLSIVGDPFNTIGLGLRGDGLVLWKRRGDRQEVLWETAAAAGPIALRCDQVGGEQHLQFQFRSEGGEWLEAGEACDASDLPAWDRGLRIGLMLEGPPGAGALFYDFALRASSEESPV